MTTSRSSSAVGLCSRAQLVARGLAKQVAAAHCGKGQPHWVASNRYVRGEPFPRPSRPDGGGGRGAREEEDEPEEQLADIELERLRNIERNKEILRSLGLA